MAPTIIELGLNRVQYETIIRDLREAGHDARLQELKEHERSLGSIVVPALVSLAIYLVGRISDQVIDEVIATVRQRLSRSKTYRGRASGVIYGEQGEVLRELISPETTPLNDICGCAGQLPRGARCSLVRPTDGKGDETC